MANEEEKVYGRAGRVCLVRFTGVVAEPPEREKNIDRGGPETALGPSGKPKIHTTNHPSLKDAKDAARKRAGKGGTTIKHPSPNGGSPHFHGVKKDGTKVRVHDSFPKSKK